MTAHEIIDAHAHIYPEGCFSAVVKTRADFKLVDNPRGQSLLYRGSHVMSMPVDQDNLPKRLASMVGLRAGIPFSVIGAVVGEFIASTRGLGFFINYNQGTYDTNGIFVGVTILALLVVVLDGLLSLAERRLLKWRPEVEAKNVGA